jgi:transcriptional regulator with XRE-family HTH domain
MKIEVRATGLRAMRQKKGLTQRQLAKDLSISQNYIPAIEAGTRRAGPELMASLVKYFRCDFWELFEVYLVNGENRDQQRLLPARDVRG